MAFEITAAEAILLRDVLARYLGDLRVEVVHTDKLENRRDLQHAEQTIKSLLGRLDVIAAAPIAG